MSFIVHDLECNECGKQRMCEMYDREDGPGACPKCGGELRIIFLKAPSTPEWGQSRYITSLDKTFESKSDLDSYLSKNDLAQAPQAEKHHGARNEEHLRLGKGFSYSGQTNRKSSAERYQK